MTALAFPELEAVAPHACNTRAVLQHTYAESLRVLELGIPGIFVECGVAGGAQVAAMLSAMRQTGQERPIHLFDSFEGIPLCGPEDVCAGQPGIGPPKHDVNLPLADRLVTSGVSACSEDGVRGILKSLGFAGELITHKGWFQHTLPGNELPEIALLRIDADLYESIKTALFWLAPKVVKGGVVIIDDWSNGAEGAGVRKAVLEVTGRGADSLLFEVSEGRPAYWYVA